MATIVLAAAGAAVGGAVGGTLAGLSSVVVGRAVGATLGRVLDDRILGAGAEPVETGKVDRFRLTQAGEGGAIAQVHGRMRVGGQVIWASDFRETVTVSGGGKGAARRPTTRRYSYSVSLAIALCEGEILAVPRVWADGQEVSPADLNMTVYTGSADQLPDPVIEAVEGAGRVPAYRGTAYVVMEDLPLAPFGNRVPQFSFEVLRAEQPGTERFETDPARLVRGVALIPGTGEYALATTPVYLDRGPGQSVAANVSTPSGQSDFVTSVEQLSGEVPGCEAVSLVVSWFGNDLRCGECRIVPKVEQHGTDGRNMPWAVAGLSRAAAQAVPQGEDGRPVYGGTPADAAVVEAIRHMTAAGKRVMFYPFILMDQMAGNGLTDPWTGAQDQPQLPWRGRITLSAAPGQAGSPDGTAAAETELAAFFGTARAADFVVGDGVVTYTGPDEWGLRRFILHYAALCASAGGVSAFCIGSELRGLTQIRGAAGFPAVQALRELAAEVRALLGPQARLGYAADWTEYFGYQPSDGSGDRYFHLDPLWADDNIDFVGIDNYMPISDWRDGEDHADARAGWKDIHDPAYLEANVEGGEGFDWYYHSPEARAAQIRTPITDDAHGEPWLWRFKDLRGWWENPHHERIGGVRQPAPTAWVPRAKPIWFTELGCAAVDKGSNQPNRFVDPKSSESGLPWYSSGRRDDLIQLRYLQAVLGHWGQAAHNPLSEVYGGPMVDLANAYVWAWDARPFPAFPNRADLWGDGENYLRGHWLNGRIGARTLDAVVAEICARSGLEDIDVSDLQALVRGYAIDQVGDARAALQPLMLRHGFDAIERDGRLVFRRRRGTGAVTVDPDRLALTDELDGTVERSREAEAQMSGRIRVRFVEWGADHDVVSEEAVLPDEGTHAVAARDLPMAMTRSEGRAVAERWLAEARLARDTVRFALPPSQMALGAGDVVILPGEGEAPRYRIDRVEQAQMQLIEAVRIEPSTYTPSEPPEGLPQQDAFAAPVPVLPLFLDLPLMSGDEVPHAPHLALTAQPWPGEVAVYASAADDGYALAATFAERSVVGVTETPLAAARAGLWDEGPGLQVRLIAGALESSTAEAVLNGANLAAIGDGSSGNWELIQFRDAQLIGPSTWWITGRLRGQLGTDGIMPDVWPEGSLFVLMDGTPGQIPLTSAQRRVARHFRIGPAARGYDDPSYTHLVEAFDGIGLRPYAPCHLRTTPTPGGDARLHWVRRTRIDGDSWDLPEVPLGEETESYLVRVMRGSTILREATVAVPEWTWTAADQAADLAGGPVTLQVAQVSARFGPGPFAKLPVGA